MTKVVHSTAGLIPIEAFTITGLSVKPNSLNPIGKFGTGLKYAIAVMVRMDISVTVFIGTTEYVFYKTKRQFRGTDYFAIRMKKRKGLAARWTYHDMPFTTEYGKYWELWQVFRELYANTLDEGGETYTTDEAVGEEGITRFVIDDSRYVDAYMDRNNTFLPDGDVLRTGDAIQVIDRPSSHIYFRGMRIMDLRKKASYTYNFLEDVALTEDRTAKYPSLVEARIVGHMQESNDKAFIDRVVRQPLTGSYESGLHHGSAYAGGLTAVTPSAVYLEAASESPIVTAKDVWNQQQPTVPTKTHITLIIPKPSIEPEELAGILEALSKCSADATYRLVDGVERKADGSNNDDEIIF